MAEPGPGQVELLNETGTRVGALITGADALEAAMARMRSGALQRIDDALAWSIVIGAGTYGDANLDEPNLVVRPGTGAAVVITGTGGADNTGGECLDVRREGVSVQGIVCRTPADRGIEVALAAAAGGVVLSGLTVDRARTQGISVDSGAGVLIQSPTIITAGSDGIRLTRLTGAGPYRIEGGSIRDSLDDGIDLVDDAQRVQIAGVAIDRSRGNGIESDDAGSSDLVVDGGAVTRSIGTGVLLGGGGTRMTVQGTQVTGGSGYGVTVARATGTVLRGLRFDGTNASGDLRFTTDARTGAVTEAIGFGAAQVTLPGNPVGVIVSSVTPAQRQALTGIPPGLLSVNRFVRVRDVGGGAQSAISLRFVVPAPELAPLRVRQVRVYEDDPVGNRRQWQEMPGTIIDPVGGSVEVALADRQIASGSDGRFATYGPLGPPNGAPEILGISPLDGGLVRGRDVVIRARVQDEEPLSTGSFLLEVDGVRRGGVAFKGNAVQFRPGNLVVGIHRARLVVVDANQLRTEKTWVFAVANGRPVIVLPRAVPRARSLVLLRRLTTIAVPVRDDLPLRTLRVSMRVDGVQRKTRIVGGRVLARVPLGRGRHRVVLSVRDRDRVVTVRRWSFRVVLP
jgi:hypothetical protein